MTSISIQCMMSSLVNCRYDIRPVRLRDGIGRDLGKAQIDDLDLVAALLVEADGGAHQRRDAVDLFLWRGW